MPGSAQETEKAVSSQEVVVCSVQEAGKVPGSAQEAEMAVDCPLQAVMAVKTPLGSRRAVGCSQQAGMAVECCSWESSGEAASL